MSKSHQQIVWRNRPGTYKSSPKTCCEYWVQCISKGCRLFSIKRTFKLKCYRNTSFHSSILISTENHWHSIIITTNNQHLTFQLFRAIPHCSDGHLCFKRNYIIHWKLYLQYHVQYCNNPLLILFLCFFAKVIAAKPTREYNICINQNEGGTGSGCVEQNFILRRNSINIFNEWSNLIRIPTEVSIELLCRG